MSKKILLGAICTVLFCGTSATVFAQDNAPSGAASSLLNSADPRAAGMGMATTAYSAMPHPTSSAKNGWALAIPTTP